MRIEGTNSRICRGRDGNLWYDFGDGWKCAVGDQIELCEELYSQMRKRNKVTTDIEVYNRVVDKILANEPDDVVPQVKFEETCQKIIDFFSEFHFEPNFRFVNTFAYACKESVYEAQDYINNYFELADSPYTSSLSEKMKSPEFKAIAAEIKALAILSNKVNQRFKLYYGSQGTGKTTKAMVEADDCMVCHSAMLPSDLMEDFKFVGGHPDFQPSVLQRAIVEGKVIVLDEINLLPFESLRFLQSILDGKKEFSYKGKTIKIADGFKIIGTMNLVVNGCTYALPEPLIDRAEQLKKFQLSANDLVGALI